MIFVSNLGSVFAEVSKEANEDKLVNILKRIGYRPIIEVYRRMVLMLFSWIFLIPIALVILYTMLPAVNALIGLTVILIVIFEMTLIDMLLKFGFGNRLGFIIKMMYYAGGFFLSLGLTYNPQMSYQKLIYLNIFAMPQLSAFGSICMYAQNAQI